MLKLTVKKTVGKGRRPFHLNISFELEKGTTSTVFFGPSGSGKTLTMNCITGLIKPDAGKIEFNGRELFNSEKKINISPQKRHMGYMPQDYGLFPHLTLIENIAYPKTGWLGRFLNKKQKNEARDLINQFGLTCLGNNFPSELSGGQKQRASLARALNSDPCLLLLDEPFSALDPLLRRQLRLQMAELLTELSLPLIVITHDPDDVDVFGQTVIFFWQGKARMVKDYQQIRKNYPSTTDCLLSLQNSLQAENQATANSIGKPG